MPERTVKRRLKNCDAALASDDGPIFSTVRHAGRRAQALHSRGNANAELKDEALRRARELARGTKHAEE
jgi:hypothetical protein